MNNRYWHTAVAFLSLLGAVVSLGVKYHFFPHFSINHDEAVYLQQAAMLLEGQLVLHPPVTDAFRPWFFVDSGTVLYPKYTPVPAAMYAVARLITGTYVAALPIIAGGVVALTTVLTAEVADRPTGVIAGVFLVASPLFVVQSGVFLPYLPTLLFELAFAVCYLRSLRTLDRRYAVVAGVSIGVAFFARPYTAVLFGTPFIAYTIVRVAATRADRRLLGIALRVAGGGLAGVGMALAYNWVLTGDPLLFPYQVFAPLDGVGFGLRRLLGYERHYDLALAFASNFVALRLYATQWIVGGVVGMVLALWGLGTTLRNAEGVREFGTYHQAHGALLLIGVGVSVILGNLAFWGTLNSLGNLADPNGIATFLGPYYHLDLLVPTVVFAAIGTVELVSTISRRIGDVPTLRQPTTIAIAILVVGVLVGVPTVAAAEDAYERNRRVTATYTDAYEPIGDRPLKRAVVFVPQPYGPWLNHPFQELRNDPGFDGPTVYALREENPFAVHRTYPERRLYRFVYRGLWAPMVGADITAAIRPVETVAGDRVTIPVTVGVPSGYESVSVVVTGGDAQATYAIDWNGSEATLDLVVTPEGLYVRGASVTQVTGADRVPVRGRDVTVRLFLDTGTGAGLTYRLDIPIDVTGGTVHVMTPYREACVDPRRCGGAGAAIPGTLPEGVFLATALNASTTR